MSKSVRKQAQQEEMEEAVTQAAGGAAEMEEVMSYEEVDKLTSLNIQASDVKKLKEAGIYTVNRILMTTKKALADIKGLSDAKVEKIVDAAMKIAGGGFLTGAEYLVKRKEIVRITTGSDTLDALLGGGIESASLTEAFGEFRTGKTQLCHTLCVTSQLPREMKGGNGKVVYIDTEGTFRPERIAPIADRFGVDPGTILENILWARAYTHEQQMRLLGGVAAKMAEDQYRLVIVDSATALFRVDFTGRGELAERQNRLGQFLSNLTKLAEEFNVACFITNQVVADPGSAAMFQADPKKPIGGHIMAHASTTRLFFKKGKGEQRICKIYDSPCLPETECTFQIGEQGIIDSKE